MLGLRRLRERLPGSGWRIQRWWALAFGVAGALALGAAASLTARSGDEERIASYWTWASLDERGGAQVVEVIDYDFGPHRRHGILRDIPFVGTTTPIEVNSPTAPDRLEVTPHVFPTDRPDPDSALSELYLPPDLEELFGEHSDGAPRSVTGVRLRIGDPSITVVDRHRYRIEYGADALVDGESVSWNAIGTAWPISIGRIEIHLTAANDLTDLSCDMGGTAERGGCRAAQVAPGHVVVTALGLSAFEGVTVSARVGDALGIPPRRPAEPVGAIGDPGFGWLLVGFVVAAAALPAGLATAWGLRRLGRERVWATSPVPAAFGPGSPDERAFGLLDQGDLDELATIEFAAPKGLTAAQGGVVYDEEVRERHKTAWLLERVAAGELVFDDTHLTLSLARSARLPQPDVAPILAAMFGRRRSLSLGTHDAGFESAWKLIEARLEDWRRQSGLWDPRGGARRVAAEIVGIVLAAAGVVAAAGGAAGASRWGSPWLLVAVSGAVIAGVGLALLLGSWELRSRTPAGSALWLQVESFRRFLAASEARHAAAAARMGLLREYTAWAVSLGEVDHWEQAVEEAASAPVSMIGTQGGEVAFVRLATRAARAAVSATTTAPRSRGRFGFRGVGGGRLGGGGISW